MTTQISLHNGIEFVHEYYVTDKRTASLYNFPFVGILCTSVENNISIKDTVMAIVKERFIRKKPTWIYAKDEVSFTHSKEYSEELEQYIEVYKKHKFKSDSFQGNIKQKIKNITNEKARSAQDSTANI